MKLKPRVTYANVMATLAVFIALGGGAYAVGLAKNSVKSKQIKNGAVAGIDVRDGGLASVDVQDDALTGTDIDEQTLQSETAQEELAKLLTVDGPGSGLDADTLDGMQGSEFLATDGTAADADKLDNLDSAAFQRTGGGGLSRGAGVTVPNGTIADFDVAGGNLQYRCEETNVQVLWLGPMSRIWLDVSEIPDPAYIQTDSLGRAIANSEGDRETWIFSGPNKVAELELYSRHGAESCHFAYFISEYTK